MKKEPLFSETQKDSTIEKQKTLINYINSLKSPSSIENNENSFLTPSKIISYNQPTNFRFRTLNIASLPSFITDSNFNFTNDNSVCSPFRTPTKNRMNIINDVENNIVLKITIPFSYVCNCHLIHNCFLNGIKKVEKIHTFVELLKNLIVHLEYYKFRYILGGKIPGYFQTRWLALFNSCSFILRKKYVINKLFPQESLPFLEDILSFRKIIYPLIEFIRFNERDDVGITNVFPIASQLLLLLRIIQNYLFPFSSIFVEFIQELSFQIYSKFFLGEKGGINALSFFLLHHMDVMDTTTVTCNGVVIEHLIFFFNIINFYSVKMILNIIVMEI
jgi:hypothetical protein